jgi:hypothetical protein
LKSDVEVMVINADPASSESGELRARWKGWACRQFTDPAQIRIAADVAVQLAEDGASSEQAASAARAAALSVGDAKIERGPVGAPGTSIGEVSAGAFGRTYASSARLLPVTGYPQGRAIRIRQRQQLANGWTIFTTDFIVELRDGTTAAVSMRGAKTSGSIQENDEIQILEARREGRTYYATSLFNRTTNREVRAQAGWRALPKPARTIIEGYYFVFAVFFLIVVILLLVIAVNFFGSAPTGPSPGFPTFPTP